MSIYLQQALNEMANYTKQKSGLPANIFFDSAGRERKVSHHYPRVKVQADTHTDVIKGHQIPVEVSKEPKRLIDKKGELSERQWNIMFDFLAKNYELILQHWNREISDAYLLKNLKR